MPHAHTSGIGFLVGAGVAQLLGGACAVVLMRRAGCRWGQIVAALSLLTLLLLLGSKAVYLAEAWWSRGAFPSPSSLVSPQMRIPGGLLLAALLGAPLCRLLGLRYLQVADILTVGGGLSLFGLRIGCWLQGCCYGTPTTLPWGITYPRGTEVFLTHAMLGWLAPQATHSLPVHPLQAYFALAGLGLFALLVVYRRRQRYDGEIVLLFFLVYLWSTWLLEFLRGRPHGVTQQLVLGAALGVTAAAAAVEWRHRRGAWSRPPWRSVVPALSLAFVIGAAAGVIDGIATLARNGFVPRNALLCLSQPILPTAVLACLLAIPLALWGASRRWPIDRQMRLVSGTLVFAAIGAWTAIWWGGVVAGARTWGSGGAAYWLATLPLSLPAIAAGWMASRLPGRLGADRIEPIVRRSAAIAVVVGVVASIPLLSAALDEGQLAIASPQAGTPRQPGELNLLLITIDTLRADRLASLGGDPGITPELDALAAEGTVFPAALSQSPWTLPSMASLFTGLPPSAHGAGRSTNPLDLLARTPIAAGTPVFPEILRDAGYATHAIVTNPFLSRRFGFGRGFDAFDNLTMQSEAALTFRDTLFLRTLEAIAPRLLARDGGATVTERAGKWLGAHRREKFFLWLHYLDAHAPYGAPDGGGHKSFRSEILGVDSAGVAPMARLRAGEVRLDAAGRRQLEARYDEGVRYDDAQVGAVLRQIEALGLRDQTVVVVTSDHGEEFWEHGGVEHGHTLYEEVVRVPLIVRWPGARAVARVEPVVRLMDLAPTFLDVAALDAGVFSEARSLRPLLLGEGEEPRVAVSEALLFGDEKIAVRHGGLKYIRSAHGKEELYDVSSDPAELRDLAVREDLIAAVRAHADGIAGARRELPSGGEMSIAAREATGAAARPR